MALLFILGSLVLISIIVLAFLSSVSTELKSSKVYADGSSVRLVADSAVNVVISQIQQATSGRDSANNRLAWASQPGMIRTYDTSGNPGGFYKLYSSSVLSGPGAFNPSDPTQGDPIPQTWDTDTALYVDLNEPLLGRYPIMNPAAEGMVEGFQINKSVAAVSGKSNPACMPVKWLYVLQDGTFVAATGSGSKASVASATPANPIVARIAFWTDDDTSKININTASEGCFWDTPRALSDYEKGPLAANQPVKKEYRRYPGHPATTCLSMVFGSGTSLPVSSPPAYNQLIPYFTLAPLINEGGSKAGTVPADATSKILDLDGDRLYATVDELEFRPNRTDLPSASIPIKPSDIEKTSFFLTANSRAPDVNLFNKPRLGIWPISESNDLDHRTLLDRMIAFCGTIGSYTYYFQRRDSNNPNTDLPATATPTGVGRNRTLMKYLQELTKNAMPGFGGDFLTKYGSDRDQILTEIFDYIRSTNINDIGDRSTFQSYTPRNKSSVTNGAVRQGQVAPISDSTNDTHGFGRFPTVSEAALVFYYTNDSTLSGSLPPAQQVPSDKIGMRAIFLPEFFTPAFGWGCECNSFRVEVEGLDKLTCNGVSMGFPPLADSKYAVENTTAGAALALTTMFGGNKDIRSFNANRNLTRSGLDTSIFPNFTDPEILVPKSGGSFNFSGGNVTVRILTKDTPGSPNDNVLVQSIELSFPQATLPLPRKSPADLTSDAKKLDLLRFSTSSPDGSGGAPLPPGTNGRFCNFGSGYGAKVATITSWDTVRSTSVASGDVRLVAGRQNVHLADSLFNTLANYGTMDTMSHTLEGALYPYYGATRGALVKNAAYYNASKASTVNSVTNFAGGGLTTPTGDQDLPGINGVAMGATTGADIQSTNIPGDWDNGVSDSRDGPYINKPDEGTIDSETNNGIKDPPYFGASIGHFVASDTFSSPNRQVPSAVMFGSLPTGVKANSPWQTLLFRPAPSPTAGSAKHKGAGRPASTPPFTTPPDYLLLDLFNMPVVEPYPISEPLSTAGRINMNYQIVPFTYITRSTGVRAVLKSERLLAIPTSVAANYKRNGTNTTDLRYIIDLDETLKGFDQRFQNNDLFRSASEICSIWLVPRGANQTYADMPAYWGGASTALTGDNSRERPYADIYPRLTTQSNVFTVHYRVQTLQKPKVRLTTAPTEFDTSKRDSVTGEFRGSSTIERYVDPNDPAIQNIDFADVSQFNSLDHDLSQYYRFRVIGSKKFTP